MDTEGWIISVDMEIHACLSFVLDEVFFVLEVVNFIRDVEKMLSFSLFTKCEHFGECILLGLSADSIASDSWSLIIES